MIVELSSLIDGRCVNFGITLVYFLVLPFKVNSTKFSI